MLSPLFRSEARKKKRRLTIVMVTAQFHDKALDVVRDTTFVALQDQTFDLLTPVTFLFHAACLGGRKRMTLLNDCLLVPPSPSP